MATERYHGSAIRAGVYGFFQPIGKRLSRLLKSFGPRKGDEMPPAALALRAQAHALSAEGDYAGALTAIRAAADIVEAGPWAKSNIGAALLRLGDCRRGLRMTSPRLNLANSGASAWNGEDLSGRTLLVWQRTRSDMGAPIRLARFVRHGEKLAERVIIVVEPRLVPLFQRTFPKTEVHPMRGRQTPREAGPGVFVTSFEALAADCVTDWDSIAKAFMPLRADPQLVAGFRASYRAGRGGPVIGITWGSRNPRKDVPDLDSWAGFVQSTPATFVSLQYGPIGPALRRLRGDQPDKLIADDTVDQMKDMDRFAAQVASLDAVVGISNTAVHLAGALDVPTIVIGGDTFRLQYPMAGTATGWYPRGIQVRRRRREWHAVLDEASARLRELLVVQ